MHAVHLFIVHCCGTISY